jgi:hypothetical protein
LLTLGGVFLGIAAVVFTWLSYTTAQSGGRAFVLAIATTLALGVPVLVARRRLTATAETIASFGLLLVLLDGYVAYQTDMAGLSAVPPALYAAIVLGLTAAVAFAYRLATHLRAPQFAALIAVQPLLPLLGVHGGLGRTGFAYVFAVVAAQNLSAVVVLGRDPAALPLLPAVHLPGGTPPWPRMLRELAWLLVGAWLAAATVLAVIDLVAADTLPRAIGAAGALLLTAAVGLVAGHLTDQERRAMPVGGVRRHERPRPGATGSTPPASWPTAPRRRGRPSAGAHATRRPPPC